MPVTTDAAAFAARPFDYLVVGGGTAGLVVAARLAEDPDVRVGVLEAGPDRRGDARIDVPGRFGSLVGDPECDWQFETVPQPGLAGRVLPWPRGRVLGGTSALNFLVWNRGARRDYDAWAALGNAGWGWEEMLPYFQKSEAFTLDPKTPPSAHTATRLAVHGRTGPITTSFAPWFAVTHQHWHAAAAAAGIRPNPAPLAGNNVGAWTVTQSVAPATGKRSYAADYVGERPNLVVLTGALVRRIVLERGGGGLRAVGVAFSVDGTPYTAGAAREVVLSAGTVQSPQLLELSGIGDRAVLERAGIAVQHHNPNVGENLQDHLMTSLVYEAPPDTYTPETLAEDPAAAAAAEELYATQKTGILRSSPSSMAYLPLGQFIGDAKTLESFHRRVAATVATSTRPRQDALVHAALASAAAGAVELILHHGNSGPFEGQPGRRYLTRHQIPQYPLSRGRVHVRAADVSVPPVIDPACYQEEADLETMVAAVRFAADMPKGPLAKLLAKRVFPPENFGEGADASWKDFVRRSTVTDWHPVGTCAMLPPDQGGVVDARLRVHGVAGLRVADASVVPLHISAHLQATVYAVAEKAADLIKEEWGGVAVGSRL